jgi:hypothetical protein
MAQDTTSAEAFALREDVVVAQEKHLVVERLLDLAGVGNMLVGTLHWDGREAAAEGDTGRVEA